MHIYIYVCIDNIHARLRCAQSLAQIRTFCHGRALPALCLLPRELLRPDLLRLRRDLAPQQGQRLRVEAVGSAPGKDIGGGMDTFNKRRSDSPESVSLGLSDNSGRI